MGGKLTASAGTFNIAAPLVIPVSYITLEGMGWSTILKPITNLNDNVIEIDTAADRYGAEVCNLQISGNSANQSTSGTGINWSGMQQGRIRNVKFYDCKTYGFYVDGEVPSANNSNVGEISGCVASNCATACFHLDAVYAWLIHDCPYIGNTGSAVGISLEVGGEVSVNNCIIDQCTSKGIYVYGSDRILIANCPYIGDNDLYGIELASNASHVSILNNILLENIKYQVKISDTADRIFMQGNEFYSRFGYTDYAIDIGASPTNIFIKNNVFNNDNEFGVIQDAGATNVVIRDNEGYIAPGELRSASGALVAGVANAFAFAWQNPEAQAVWVQLMVEITTAGGTAGSLLDAGSAADATTHSDNLIDGADLNATNLLVSSAWVKLDANGGATDYITGQILVENAASLVGRYFVKYMGAA